MKYFLLTYNPDSWSDNPKAMDDEWAKAAEEYKKLPFSENRSTKWKIQAFKQIQEGDMCFILRQGKVGSKRGIFAAAYAYIPEGGTLIEDIDGFKYVNLILCYLNNPVHAKERLTTSYLKEHFPNVKWSIQGGGIEIKDTKACECIVEALKYDEHSIHNRLFYYSIPKDKKLDDGISKFVATYQWGFYDIFDHDKDFLVDSWIDDFDNLPVYQQLDKQYGLKQLFVNYKEYLEEPWQSRFDAE